MLLPLTLRARGSLAGDDRGCVCVSYSDSGPDSRDTGHLMTCMRGDWMTDAHGGTLCKHAH